MRFLCRQCGAAEVLAQTFKLHMHMHLHLHLHLHLCLQDGPPPTQAVQGSAPQAQQEPKRKSTYHRPTARRQATNKSAQQRYRARKKASDQELDVRTCMKPRCRSNHPFDFEHALLQGYTC